MRTCIFCEVVAGRLPSSRFHEDDRIVGFLDIHPWRPGHALIVPRAHHQRLGDMPAGDVAAIVALGVRVAEAMRDGAVPCDDAHFVLNDGPAASQSVPHAHLHVVPRVKGDAWRLLARLLRHPLTPLLGPTARDVLDGQAAAIRDRLRREDP